MRKILIFLSLLLTFHISYSQAIQNRGTATFTYDDARLMAGLNFFLPRYADTTAANISKGIDTCGALISTYNNSIWNRQCFVGYKKWVLINQSVPLQFNPIQGNGILISGIYPNITFQADTSILGTKNLIKKRIDSLAFLKVSYVDTSNMLNPYHAAYKGASFDTTTRILYLYPIVGNSPTLLTIPAGGAASGMAAVTTTRLGNILKSQGDNGFNWFFSVRDADSATILHTTDTSSMLSNLFRLSDTLTQFLGYQRKGSSVQYIDTSSMLSPLLRKSDTTFMLSTYIKVQLLLDSLTQVQSRIQAKQPLGNYLIPSDTTGKWLGLGWFSALMKYSDTSVMLSNLLKISDTLTMLSNLLRKTDTTTMLSGYQRSGNPVTVVAQPNITSLGILTSLTVAGDINFGGTAVNPGVKKLKVFDQTVFLGSMVIGNGGFSLTTSAPYPLSFPGSTGSNAGGYNFFAGIDAGLYNTSASFNTFVGAAAGKVNTIGDQNTAIGANAFQANTTGYHSTAIGAGALQVNTTGFNNVSVGTDNLLHNTTGNENTSIGTDAMSVNTTGSENTAIGRQSMGNNTTASYNTALGHSSLFANTTGYDNTSIGHTSLINNTTGYRNSAFGKQSLFSNTTGYFNTSVGYSSLFTNITGYGNTAVGVSSLISVDTGFNNTSIGTGSGSSLVNGNTNTFIGYGSGSSASQKVDAVNSTAIGNGSYTTANNQMVFGNSSVTSVIVNGVAQGTAGLDSPLTVVNGAIRKISPSYYATGGSGVLGILGTTSQIIASSLTGTVTLSLPTNLGSFNNITSTTFTGALNGNASTATTAGTVTTAAQPNITSVGLLTNLSVTGIIQAASFTGSGTSLTGIVKNSDSATMLSPYLHFQAGVKYFDTATMLSPYAHSQAVVKYYDTSSMVSNRLKISDTLTMLSNRLKISDTATMLTRGWLSNRSSDTASTLRTLANSKYTGGTVTSVAAGNGLTFTTITGSGSVVLDTTIASTKNNVLNQLNKYAGTSNTTTVGTLSAGSIPYSLLTGTPSLSGYLTAIGVTTANGVSGSSSGGTTPNLTITLGAIVPSSVVASGNITATNFYGTIGTAAQPNITSLGTLSQLTVTGIINGSITGNSGSVTNSLTATDGTLTFSGPYNGSVARTVGLNLGTANTWSAAQIFPTTTKIEGSGAPNFILNSTNTGSGTGPYVTLKRNGSDIGYWGSDGALLSNTTNDVALMGISQVNIYAGAGYPKIAQISLTGIVVSGSVTATSLIKSGGTSSQFLMADGSVSTGGNGYHGTYSPTVANIANTSGLSVSPAFYQGSGSSSGNVITVGFEVSGTGTVSLLNQVSLTIPTGANFSTGLQCWGSGANETGVVLFPVVVSAVNGTNTVVVSFTPPVGTTGFGISGTFTYQVQ